MPTCLPEYKTSPGRFPVLQEQRHQADYDPDAYFRRSFVIRLIDRAENAIHTLYSTDVAERRSLAMLVLLRDR